MAIYSSQDAPYYLDAKIQEPWQTVSPSRATGCGYNDLTPISPGPQSRFIPKRNLLGLPESGACPVPGIRSTKIAKNSW
jgi:hypothetical protein